ncbi:hypothetical protein [Paracholeplasma manati]|uniref:hypothetical protein n=1 Tax=Paracholeplasma manati TaxID=591373 RepID=UPI002407F868|nr:hypothetical protein [Paracholeplasma manati]MDG0888782.1 hypothetical protein [Paracholeplasma manati]
MINTTKKLLLALSLFVAVVLMGLTSWGPLTPLLVQADTTPVPASYTYDDFLLNGQVKVNGTTTSVSGYTTNGYVTAPSMQSNTVNLTFPDYRTSIGDWESITVTSTKIKITALYVGDEMQRSYQSLFASYSGQQFTQINTYSNQTTPLIIEGSNMDARTLPTNMNLDFFVYDNRTSFGFFTGLAGQLRIYSIEMFIEYEYPDEISPLLDGAGSLVASKNIVNPDITGKTIVSDGIYRLNSKSGITVDYEPKTGYFIINGTPTTVTEVFTIISLYSKNITSNITLTFTYISGTRTNNTLSNDYVALFRTDNIGNVATYFKISNHQTITSNTTSLANNLSFVFTSTNASTYTDYKVRIQAELGSTPTTWMHPSSIYYSTASIQHDQNPDSVTTIMSNVYAYDDVDGDISDQFQVVDTPREYAAVLANRWRLNVNDTLAGYDADTLNVQITNTITLNKAYVDAQFATYQTATYWYNLDNDTLVPYNLVQSYKFMAYVGDASGNYSFLEISVFVNDATAPTFDAINPDSVTVSYKTTYNLAAWASAMVITDNADTNVDRVIYTDNYTANKSVPGTYTVIVRATDDTGNTKDKTFTFIVVDDIAPVFNGPESIFKPQSSTMTVADIKARYTAFDEISGTVTSRITIYSDGYTGRGHLVGTYIVVFRVTDLAGNITDISVPITVSDDIPPVIYVADGYFIQVSSAYLLTIEGIRDILVATGRLEIVSATTYQVLVNEYEGNENTPGIYTISIRFSQTSGVTEVHSVAVNVKNASTIPDGSFNPPAGDFPWVPIIIVGVLVVGFIFYKTKH